MNHHRGAPHDSGTPGAYWLKFTLLAGSVIVLITALGALWLSLEDRSAISDAAPTGNAGLILHISPIPRPNIPMLQQYMLDLINEERRANGLPELGWDETAALAGLNHAQEMARLGYMGHRNLEGYGPDHRYSLVGGLDNVRENAYLYQQSLDDRPEAPDDWKALVRQAHQKLMESPSHRENILAREHTHVGIGLAYEANVRRLSIAQEFVDHYLTLESLPNRASVGDTIAVIGRLGPHITSPLLSLAYEPLPHPMNASELRQGDVYESSAQSYQTIALVLEDGQFEQNVRLDYEGRPGLYHIRIWGQVGGEKMLATDVVLDVR